MPDCSSSSEKTHEEMVTYIFSNMSTLKRVLENDKALSNMLYDMISMSPPLPKLVNPIANNSRSSKSTRYCWGEDD